MLPMRCLVPTNLSRNSCQGGIKTEVLDSIQKRAHWSELHNREQLVVCETRFYTMSSVSFPVTASRVEEGGWT